MVPAHRVHPRRCAVGVGEFPFGDGGLDDIADGVHPMRKVDGGVEVSSCRPQIGGFSTIWCARGEERCQLLPCCTAHAGRCSADGFVDGAVPVQDEVFGDCPFDEKWK